MVISGHRCRNKSLRYSNMQIVLLTSKRLDPNAYFRYPLAGFVLISLESEFDHHLPLRPPNPPPLPLPPPYPPPPNPPPCLPYPRSPYPSPGPDGAL